MVSSLSFICFNLSKIERQQTRLGRSASVLMNVGRSEKAILQHNKYASTAINATSISGHAGEETYLSLISLQPL